MSQQANAPSVLIVDDHQDNIELVSQILEQNYQILSANNGADSLTLAEKEQPDLILLDVMMPEMNGYQVLNKLLGNEKTLHIPVIFLTAHYTEADRIVTGLELGAFDYITKPIKDEILLAKVGVATRVKRAEDVNLQQKIILEKKIDEISNAQAALRASNLKLDRSNKELAAFSYSVSHDLRAPLRGIAGFSQILLEDNEDQLDEQGKEYLQRLCRGVERMDNLISHLLSLSQLSNNALNRRSVNLSEVAKSILKQLQEDNPKRQLEISIKSDITADADPVLINSMLTNLLDNAWKYTEKKEQTHIEFDQTQIENETVFYIKDNGAGFDMKHSDKLFTPFQRLHSKHEFLGTGIGLTTVQRIIHRHGGRVWAESKENQGATFFFTLPTEKQS